MKHKLHKNKIWLITILIFSIKSVCAQVEFSAVPNSTLHIRGDLQIIGNSIVGLDEGQFSPNDDYNGDLSNNSRTFGYIDIDGDASTFSSSSADLNLTSDCSKIAYAGLYWAASYFVETTDNGDYVQYEDLPFPDNRPDFRTLKIKPPGVANYITIDPSETTVIYDGYRNTATNPNDVAAIDIPYVCYADVTSVLQGLNDLSGTYTIADMRASTGFSTYRSNGISGGWVLVVAYEDSSLSPKYISTQQGFLNNQPCSITTPGCVKEYTYDGFTTLPSPLPVHARYAVAVLEGDQPYDGDVLQIKRPDGTREDIFTAPANPSGNFFDSSISVDGNYVTTRNPASQNTLGFDADIFNINNPNNAVIGNDQTSATFYTTSTGDAYSIFFNALCIEDAEPKLTVTNRVLDQNGIDITGAEVDFGDQLFYELTIKNTGNEDLINANIIDILPDNVDFIGNFTTSDSGITATLDPTGRVVNIDIDDTLLVKDGGVHTVTFGVRVVPSCLFLRDICSNEIANIAVSSYTGASSGFIRIDEESILGQDQCNNDIIGSANVLINSISACSSIGEPALLCTGELHLIARSGFISYEWIEQSNPTVVLGTEQTLTITDGGKYQVTKIKEEGCLAFIEVFEVDSFDNPPNLILEVTDDIYCDAGGSIQVINASPEYEYQLVSPSGVLTAYQASAVFTELIEAGVYTVNARPSDTVGTSCIFQSTIVLEETDPEVYIVPTGSSCSYGKGSVFIRVMNSKPNYTYTLTSTISGQVITEGPTTTSEFTFTNLDLDTYELVVESGDGGCRHVSTVILEEANGLEIENASLTSPISCAGGSDAEISFTVAKSPYFNYEVISTDSGEVVSSGFSESPTITVTGLSAGMYTVEVFSDAISAILCRVSTMVEVSEPAPLVFSATVENEICNENGTIVVSGSGGNPPYNFSMSSNGVVLATAFSGLGQYVFTELDSGVYEVTVEDTNGCIVDVNSIEVQGSIPIVANITIEPLTLSSDAIITVSASGGTGTFIYELMDQTSGIVVIPAQSSNILAVDEAGNYIVNVLDTNGCQLMQEVVIIPVEQHPLLDFAEEIFVCTLTGQSYPMVSIENEDGEPLEISAVEGATIVWQQLDTIMCAIELEDGCPTSDSNCSSDWFDIDTGNSCSITEEGQYRIVITFETKNSSDTQIYYFRAERNMPTITEEITMYPNPSNGMVYVNTDVRRIEIFDAVGKLVKSTYNNFYSVHDLGKGIYFARIETAEKEHFIKLVRE